MLRRTVRLISRVIPRTPGSSGTVKRLTSHTLTATTAKRPRSVPRRLIHHHLRRLGSKKTAVSDIGDRDDTEPLATVGHSSGTAHGSWWIARETRAVCQRTESVNDGHRGRRTSQDLPLHTGA